MTNCLEKTRQLTNRLFGVGPIHLYGKRICCLIQEARLTLVLKMCGRFVSVLMKGGAVLVLAVNFGISAPVAPALHMV